MRDFFQAGYSVCTSAASSTGGNFFGCCVGKKFNQRACYQGGERQGPNGSVWKADCGGKRRETLVGQDVKVFIISGKALPDCFDLFTYGCEVTTLQVGAGQFFCGGYLELYRVGFCYDIHAFIDIEECPWYWRSSGKVVIIRADSLGKDFEAFFKARRAFLGWDFEVLGHLGYLLEFGPLDGL